MSLFSFAKNLAARFHKPRRKQVVFSGLALLLAVGGWFGYKLYADVAKLTRQSNPIKLVKSFTPSTLKETNGRINVLLAGYSADDTGHAGAELTDSIMILSINLTTKQAEIISVPRDLYVEIPGYGYSKINAAYEYGQSENFSESGYASGGMGLLEKVIETNLGVHSNYYALINYTAFKDAVNAVDGVTVDIESTDARGLYDSNTGIKLSNGSNTLDGTAALALARSRGDGAYEYGFPQGDFNRTQNQQLILMALKDKLSDTSIIANPLKIGSLADALGDNVKTDMTIGEIETFYQKVKGISDSNMNSVTLNSVDGQNLLTDYTTANGQSALIPKAGVDNFTDIQSAISSLLQANNSASSTN